MARLRPLAALTAASLAAALTTVPAHAAFAAPAPTRSTSVTARLSERDVDQVPCAEHIGANATYHANGATYTTDAQGRPLRAEADDLTAGVADRGPCQRAVGHMGPTAGYDGGHLIAATLHGVDERYDLVPQWASVNRGIYERMESGAKKCLQAPGGRITHYRIRVSYPDATALAPDLYFTDVAIDTAAHTAQTIRLTIPNRALDNTEYTRLRRELDQRLTAAGCT
ncbi:DNA/RNA non-specific endonuclease [Spirillospora sp. NPDC000708]